MTRRYAVDHTRYVTLDSDDECIKGLRDGDADQDACGIECARSHWESGPLDLGGLNDLNRGEAVWEFGWQGWGTEGIQASWNLGPRGYNK